MQKHGYNPGRRSFIAHFPAVVSLNYSIVTHWAVPALNPSDSSEASLIHVLGIVYWRPKGFESNLQTMRCNVVEEAAILHPRVSSCSE